MLSIFKSATVSDKPKFTPEELAQIKVRSKALEEQQSQLRALNDSRDEIEIKIIELKNEERDLTYKIFAFEDKVKKEENDINELVLIKVDLATRNIPDELTDQAKVNVNLLIELVNIVHKKYGIKRIRGEYNLLEADALKIHFSKGRSLSANFDDIEGKFALEYFKSLGGCSITDTGIIGSHSGTMCVTLSSERAKLLLRA